MLPLARPSCFWFLSYRKRNCLEMFSNKLRCISRPFPSAFCNFRRSFSTVTSSTLRQRVLAEEHHNSTQVKTLQDDAKDIENINSFHMKTTKDLLRTWLILKMSSFNVFVDNSERLLKISKKFLGERMYEGLLKATFYGQFAGGETWEGLKKNVNILRQHGIRSMLCIPIETSIDHDKEDQTWEERWKANTDIMQECINTTDEIEKEGFSQIRITALCGPDLLVEVTKQLIDYESNHCEPHEWSFQRMGELFNSDRFEEIEIPSLSAERNFELREALKRLDRLAKACKEKHLKLMIDAEQTYIQSALGYFILLLQQKYNTGSGVPVVYNTYQCYRKDTLKRIQADYELAKENGFKIACKLVRGAYMIEERRIAAEKGKEDPICDGFHKTTEMYHSVVDFILPLIKSRQAGVMIASHNESTVLYTLKRMQEMNMERDGDLLCFAQLYGMCDHVTEGLAKVGCQVYKSVPYGTIDSTLLYLVRRAQENRSVLERGKEERKLILNEVIQRLKEP